MGLETAMQSAGRTQLFFEDLVVGMRTVGRERELTQADFQAFAALTGDAHPIHYDQAYAARSSFGRCVAHGLLLADWRLLEPARFQHGCTTRWWRSSARK
jgi:acyl dehydratase